MITCEELCLGTLSASSLFFPWWEPILSDETPREIYDSWFPLGGSVLRQRVEFRESLSLHWLDFNCLPLKIINMSLIMVACWWAPPVVFWRGIFCCPSAVSTKIRNTWDLWPSNSVSVDLLYLYTDMCVKYLVYQMLTGELFVVYKRP